MTDDLGSLSESSFLKKYGHLRPGTYDILSERYDEKPEKYFSFDDRDELSSSKTSASYFGLSLQKMNKVKELLVQHGIDQDVVDMFNFLRGHRGEGVL